jgi:hypothetical protein
MKYMKYRWDEDRGDEYASWGCSWWYFEIGPDGYPVRHVEIYDSGMKLRYGPDQTEDQYGGLAAGHESEMDHQWDEPLSAEEFEAVWQSATRA